VVCWVVLVACAGCTERETPDQQEGPPPPPVVAVAVVGMQEVNEPFEFVGRMEALQAVDVRARVQGFLEQRRFEEGDVVQAGTLLFVIEPDQYEVRLASAQADLARAEANLQERKRTLTRVRGLRQRGVVSEAELDEAIAAHEMAQAEVQVARAAVQAAQLNLDYTRIQAPITGRIGRAFASVGNLVGPDSGPLARLIKIDPIRVVFSISESALVNVMLALQETSLKEFSQSFVPRIRLPNDTLYAHAGRIDFVDNEVDPTTGTVAVRALFPNENAVLLPGQFVTAVVRRQEGERLPVVPQSAVQEDREGRYVLVVDDQNRASQRRLQTGPRTDQGWAVAAGLQAGETIIVQGVQKVRPGMTVRPVMEGQPAEAQR
jgi:membrane fusion protein (multidrug efflux system)